MHSVLLSIFSSIIISSVTKGRSEASLRNIWIIALSEGKYKPLFRFSRIGEKILSLSNEKGREMDAHSHDPTLIQIVSWGISPP